MTNRTAIVWLRRDLRLADQPALHHACTHFDQVIPLFVWHPDEDGDWPPGAASRWWLHHSLAAFQTRLKDFGPRLVIRQGAAAKTLLDVAREMGASAVFWNRLYEPAIARRDAEVASALQEHHIEVEHFNGALLTEPGEIRTGSGGPYKVFSAFWRAVLPRLDALEALPEPRSVRGHRLRGDSLDDLGLLPRLDWAKAFPDLWTPGEAGARERLDRFCDTAISGYAEARERPDLDGTTRLSSHLHFGEISPRQIAIRVANELRGHSAKGYRHSCERLLAEVGWREFAHHLLHHFPHTPTQPLDPRFSDFPWRDGRSTRSQLERWQQGRTGIPIVDAGMRQLWTHGWMHNRVRMIVASYLTKNLLVPWQAGAAWFWDTLVDASLANNTLGWQWTAGCGADAAPYFRVFNPVLQSRRHDPEGAYLRQWIPELAELSGKAIHDPWTLSPPPADYPPPDVDLGSSRERALAAWRELRSASR